MYYKVGRVNYILDNLLAQGQAEEMIVVLPYGNPYKLLPTPPEGMFGAPGSKFGSDVFSLDLNNDLMPYMRVTTAPSTMPTTVPSAVSPVVETRRSSTV